jgi:hypothetical protein
MVLRLISAHHLVQEVGVKVGGSFPFVKLDDAPKLYLRSLAPAHGGFSQKINTGDVSAEIFDPAGSGSNPESGRRGPDHADWTFDLSARVAETNRIDRGDVGTGVLGSTAVIDCVRG